MLHSKCTLRINLDTIKNNYQLLQKKCPGAEVGAAIKANCYGLGMAKIAPLLKQLECKTFFVANSDEGIIARKMLNYDVNICVLHGVFNNDKRIFKEYKLIPVLNCIEQAILWHSFADECNEKLDCFLHIDTGMHRLGMSEQDLNIVIAKLNRLNILYIMSHLACAEEQENELNKIQLQQFTNATSNIPYIKKSLANSSGIFLGKNYHFDLTRAGAAIYGINPILNEQSGITNSLELLAPIIQIRELPPLASIGYGQTYINNTGKNCKIATIAIGYADGFLRQLSNKISVYINAAPAPVLGLISMDLTVIDVSSIAANDLFLGQQVEIMGINNTPESLATVAGTNAYEILTNLGNRFEKVYTQES